MEGIGERLTPADAVPHCHLVLVNPGVELPTPDVFRALEHRENAGMGPLPQWSSDKVFATWLAGQRNDLETPARYLAPVIGEVLAALGDARVARMSGSGATCYGLYSGAELAGAAERRISSTHPGWWVRAVTTTGGAAA